MTIKNQRLDRCGNESDQRIVFYNYKISTHADALKDKEVNNPEREYGKIISETWFERKF